MRRLTFRLAVAIIAFAIGIASAALWSISRHSSSNVLQLKTFFPTEKVNRAILLPQKRVYKSGDVSCDFVDRYRVCSSQLESSDGMGFSITSIFYDSPKQAHKQLLLNLEDASNPSC